MSMLYKIQSELIDSPLTEQLGDGQVLLRTDLLKNEKILALSSSKKVVEMIPAGYILKTVIVKNNTSDKSITLNMGTTNGGTDILNGSTVAGGVIYTATVNKLFSFSANKDIFIQSSDWNSADIDVYFLMEKPVVVGDAFPTSTI